MNPFDQFDAPQAAQAGGNPFDQFDPKPAGKPKVDMFDAVSDNALQSATFGIGNRAQAGLAALVASGINGKGISENYKNARNVETQRLSEEMSQHPVASIVSNIGGALATGGLASGTKAGAAVTDWLGSGGIAARMGKGAVAGATSGAAYGAGTAAYDKSLEGAKSGAVSGAVVGGAIPAAGAILNSAYEGTKNAIQGAVARSPEAVQDATEALKNKAGAVYDQMRQIGATFKPSAVQGFLLPDVDKAIAQNNFIPALNPKTVAIVDDLKQKAAAGNLGLDELDQYRRLLGRIGNTEDGVSAGAVRKAIDNFVGNSNNSHLASGGQQAVTLLKQGRAQYAQASKFEDIADIISKAAGDPNKIKSGLQRFLNNTNNLRGYTAQELDALRNAASNTTGEKLLKMAGKFGIDLGTSLTPGNTVAPVVGAVASGSPITPVAGTLARQTQKYLARGKAENLLQTIENGGQAAASGGSGIASPILSAPAGAAAGIMNNMRSRIPAGMQQETPQITPQVTTPAASISPQSNNQQPELFSRVIQQESGGKQFNAKGNPLISSKGAVGASQIKPAAAYDAAKTAGIPYDPRRIYTDEQYNRTLGNAYLGMMQKKYGDDTTALIAYNWGPGNTDRWLKAGGDFNKLPAETKNYVKRILGA